MIVEKKMTAVKVQLKSGHKISNVTKSKSAYVLYNNYIKQENKEIDNAIFTLNRLCVKK